jgi:hypothetical protein
MAIITSSRTSTGNTRSMVIKWEGLANGDTGAPIDFSQYSDRSVQVVGTFGVNGSVRLEGSIDGINYAALTDPQGNNLDISTAKIEAVTELVLYVRPQVTAGDGSTNLSVFLLIKE